MATITVTNLNDSGAGSLRQAIADAEAQAGADTIMFADTLAGGTITLQDALRFTQDELLIEGDIDGDGAFDITISGGGTSQLVNNYGSADTTINGVYFDQGYDNKNYSYVIFNDTNAALTISNSYIVNSDVTNQSGFGGTIVSLSDLTLTNVLIDQASAVAVNSSPTTTGILNVYGGTLTIDRVGVSGGGVGSFLGVTNYGDVSGGVLGIGQGETGDEGTGLRNIPTNGSLTIGVTGDRAANTIDVSGASGDQAVLGFGGGDTITGSNNSDLLFGGAGDDQFQTTGGSHKIYGDGGADEIVVNADSAGYSFIDTGDGLRILGYSQDHRVNGVETITFNDITLSAAAARAQSDELSTLVTNLNDSGDGSLRRAIFEASVLGGTRDVTFSEDLAGGTIRLSSVLDIDASTAVNIMGDLNGDRIADITISGDVDGNGVASFGDTRHFTIESGGYLSLDGVNLIGGADIALPLAGGGLTRASSIDNAGVLKLRDLSITDGTANAQDLATAGDASVIYNRTSGDLSLTDVVFYDNTSIGGSFITGTGDIDGGGATVGIFNDGGRVGATRFGVANSTATGGDGSNGQTTKGGDGGDANSILLNTGGSVSVYASGVAGNTLTAGAGGAGGFTFDGPIIIDLDDGDDGNAVDDAAYVGSPNPFVSPLAGVTGTNVDDTFTDSASKGIVLGFGGNDVFNGDQSLSRIYGGTGDDTLVVTGDRFVAEFFGGKGVDTVDLRGATVSAGPGYNFELAPYPNTPEFLRFFNGVSMRAAADIERIFGSDGADRLVAGDTAMTISGGAGDDYLGGGANRDTLRGDSGGDIVVGGGGADALFGGGQKDQLRGEGGADSLNGGGAADTLLGGGGKDELRGGAGGDTLRGGDGGDTINGGAGDDDIQGDDGADKATGDAGRDQLIGGKGEDTLIGGGGNDSLVGGGGADRLLGGAGADRLTAGAGADTLTGGGWADQFIFAPRQGVNLVKDFQNGVDKIKLSGVASFSQLTIGEAQGDAVIRFKMTVIKLDGVDSDLIDRSDFIFGRSRAEKPTVPTAGTEAAPDDDPLAGFLNLGADDLL